MTRNNTLTPFNTGKWWNSSWCWLCFILSISRGIGPAYNFALKTLTKSEQKYSQIEIKALAIVGSIKMFYLYIKWKRFTWITDYNPLVAIFGSKRGLPSVNSCQITAFCIDFTIFQFEFDKVFRKTDDYGNADFLSRYSNASEELKVKDDITVFQGTIYH